MTKYFAKYLAIAGEIKEGDKIAWDNLNHLIVGITGTKSSINTLKNDNYKPAKLFLVSRDIQAGDKFTQVGIDMLHPTARFTCTERFELNGDIDVKDEDEKIYVIYNKDYPDKLLCYKVIGEISRYATWIKEGDEFEEEQIEFQGSDNPPFEGWETIPYEYYKLNTMYPIKRIRIKGPCNHFH